MGLLCNLFSAEALEIESVSNGNAGYGRKDSFLETNTPLFFGEGVVTSNYDTGLRSNNTENAKTVTIDGIEFLPGDTVAYGYLGVMCKYFYRKHNGKNVLLAIYPSEDCTVDIYKTSQEIIFNEISQDCISIEVNGKKKEYKLNSHTSVIYNGIATDTPLSALVDTENFVGTVTIINNDSGSEPDCVWIDSAYSFLIENIGIDTISDKDNILEHKKNIGYVNAVDIKMEELSASEKKQMEDEQKAQEKAESEVTNH